MFNKVIIMGRLTKAPELKTTPTGNAVCSFAVAVDRRFVGKDGERQTDFFDCVAWRNTAEFISRYFGKGAMILIDGELQTRSYTDKNGQERHVVEINVDTANFTGEKRDNAQPQNQQPHRSTYNAEDFADTQDGEGYPF